MSFEAWQRKIIFARASARCEECSKKWDDGWYMECHHIIPLADGGQNHTENGKLLCIDCHAKAHDKLSNEAKKRGDSRSVKANAFSARQIRKRNKRRLGH